MCASNFLWNVNYALKDGLPALKQAAEGGLIITGDDSVVPAFCQAFNAIASMRGKWEVAHPSNLDQFGTMHSKFVIGVYKAHCSVAIVSGNFVPKDYDRKTQSVWYQCFPLKRQSSFMSTSSTSSSSSSAAPGPTSDFERHFLAYFQVLGQGNVPVSTLVAHLRRFDFSAATAQLVASVPGRHTGPELSRWGHMRLRALLLNEPPTDAARLAGRRTSLVCQYSSQGSIKEGWMRSEWHDTCTATRGAAAAHRLSGAKRPRSSGSGSAYSPNQDPIHLVWPTVEFVRRSIEGWAGGASVPCPPNNHRPDITDRHCRYEADVSGRGRSIPHIKTFMRIATPRTTGSSSGGSASSSSNSGSSSGSSGAAGSSSSGSGSSSSSSSSSGSCNGSGAAAGSAADDVDVLWLYTGSHNFSKAAWGELQKDASQLFIRSYELGVLFTPGHYAQALQRLDAVGQGPLASLSIRQSANAAASSSYAAAAAAAPASSLSSSSSSSSSSAAQEEDTQEVDLLSSDNEGSGYEAVFGGNSRGGSGRGAAAAAVRPRRSRDDDDDDEEEDDDDDDVEIVEELSTTTSAAGTPRGGSSSSSSSSAAAAASASFNGSSARGLSSLAAVAAAAPRPPSVAYDVTFKLAYRSAAAAGGANNNMNGDDTALPILPALLQPGLRVLPLPSPDPADVQRAVAAAAANDGPLPAAPSASAAASSSSSKSSATTATAAPPPVPRVPVTVLLPAPFRVPAVPYSRFDLPWNNKDVFSGRDGLGRTRFGATHWFSDVCGTPDPPAPDPGPLPGGPF